MSVVGEWSTGDLVWFDPGVGHWLPGEVLENHRSANVLTVQAVINGKVPHFSKAHLNASALSRVPFMPSRNAIPISARR